MKPEGSTVSAASQIFAGYDKNAHISSYCYECDWAS
jgi:hypothetical protein